MAALMWRPLGWMTGFGLGLWALIAVTFGERWHPEAAVGLAAPLLSANLSWMAMVRAHQAGNERLMAVMVRAMAIKMVTFGVYVALMFTVLNLRPVPFAASFTVGFVGLYVMEAGFLSRLLKSQVRRPSA